jgi:hypothetical protein
VDVVLGHAAELGGVEGLGAADERLDRLDLARVDIARVLLPQELVDVLLDGLGMLGRDAEDTVEVADEIG